MTHLKTLLPLLLIVQPALAQLPSGVTSLAPRQVSPFCQQFAKNAARATGAQSGKTMCVDTPIGLIPDVANMISSIFTAPADTASVSAGSPIQLAFTVSNLDMAARPLDLTNNYLMAPQTLSKAGLVEGFPSVSVQRIDNPTNAPQPLAVQFFQSFTKASPNSSFQATIPPRTLPPGSYRVCTMVSALAGQPVIMPVAQRGSQDDCIRITVTP